MIKRIFKSAGGGTRTHKPLLTADFESASFANFDTPAYVKHSMKALS